MAIKTNQELIIKLTCDKMFITDKLGFRNQDLQKSKHDEFECRVLPPLH